MKVREFLKTDEFKKADMIDYLYEDGSEYNGSHAELMKHEIINMIIFELWLNYIKITINDRRKKNVKVC